MSTTPSGSTPPTSVRSPLARRAVRTEPPPVVDAARWVHGALVPAGLLDADETMTVTRTLVFAGASDAPTGLASAALSDLQRMVASADLRPVPAGDSPWVDG